MRDSFFEKYKTSEVTNTRRVINTPSAFTREHFFYIQEAGRQYMLDRIDERDKQERMHRSIVKYWNVNYIPTPYAEPKEEQTGEKEDAVTGQQLPVEPELTVSSANYGNEEVTDEVTKGQIDKILHEKTEAIRSLIEQNKQTEEEQDIPEEMASAPIQHIIE